MFLFFLLLPLFYTVFIFFNTIISIKERLSDIQRIRRKRGGGGGKKSTLLEKLFFIFIIHFIQKKKNVISPLKITKSINGIHLFIMS